MLRSYTLADLFTLGNAACGTTALFLCLTYLADGRHRWLWAAFLLIPCALILDGFDGYVARKRNSSSAIGADLDSLADVVSFGVAPAALAFTLGMRGIWDSTILVYFVVCGISRLARYNVTMEDLTDDSSGKVAYFEGTPIPTSVLLVAMLGIAFWVDAVHADLWLGMVKLGPFHLHPLVLLFGVSGSLMISTIRIPKP